MKMFKKSLIVLILCVVLFLLCSCIENKTTTEDLSPKTFLDMLGELPDYYYGGKQESTLVVPLYNKFQVRIYAENNEIIDAVIIHEDDVGKYMIRNRYLSVMPDVVQFMHNKEYVIAHMRRNKDELDENSDIIDVFKITDLKSQKIIYSCYSIEELNIKKTELNLGEFSDWITIEELLKYKNLLTPRT